VRSPSDYPPWLRREMAQLMEDLEPGAWGRLGVCPGPYGCPFSSDEEAIASGVLEGNFCMGCRVVEVYRPKLGP